ncbi:MAG: TonB-dependent receptor [Bacteroidia bacterium]|nr:TonB-dependent receptor [Bacteroidia bacterium]
MKYLFGLIGLFSMVWGQAKYSGQVLSPTSEPLFAANIVLKSNLQKGVITDLEGRFQWIGSESDTLIISYPGYELHSLPLLDLDESTPISIKLKEKSLSLDEISIRAYRPIAEEFSVVRMEKLDIYLNPISAADPLRAITVLPASTNTQESANPSLRGSAANRSRVILNGVPIYNPVRNSQINGLGNFSLFNTELLESQSVYASNPPLTYGNSSGGLVQIETNRELKQNSTQLSLSLANAGIFRSQQLGDRAFLQAYGNYQFSGAFTGIQPNSLDFLKSFSTQDAGLYLFLPLSPKWELQNFVYGIAESYRVETQVFAHRDDAFGSRKRAFNVLRLKRQAKNSIWSTQGSLDLIQSKYNFGNLQSRTNSTQGYFSTEYKSFIGRKFSWQAGANYDSYGRHFRDSSSILYFSNRPDIPSSFVDTQVFRPLVEAHVYASWSPNESLKLSTGLRSNLPLAGQSQFLSFQGSMRWNPNSSHSFLLSGGRYHSYGLPNFFLRGNELLASDQLALDYSWSKDNFRLAGAAFAKDEKGLQNEGFIFIQRSRIFGLEGSLEVNFAKYFRASIANSFLIHRIRFSENSEEFNGNMDLPYFVKASLAFNHPKWFSFTAVWLGRSGTYFTPIIGGEYLEEFDLYEPQWPNSVFSERLPDYHNLSLSLSRYQLLSQGSLVLFFSVNNVLNRLNPQDIWYSEDFREGSFAPFSLRTFYFGVVWSINDQ